MYHNYLNDDLGVTLTFFNGKGCCEEMLEQVLKIWPISCLNEYKDLCVQKHSL